MRRYLLAYATETMTIPAVQTFRTRERLQKYARHLVRSGMAYVEEITEERDTESPHTETTEPETVTQTETQRESVSYV